MPKLDHPAAAELRAELETTKAAYRRGQLRIKYLSMRLLQTRRKCQELESELRNIKAMEDYHDSN
jgi:hypothetical protein